MSTATAQKLSKREIANLLHYLRRVVAKGPDEERELVGLVASLESQLRN